jgi:hypothetical protein
MNISQQAVNVLYNKFNRDGFGVDFGSFLQLCAHVASAKSAFAWENTAQGNRGTITLSMDKFIEMSGRC